MRKTRKMKRYGNIYGDYAGKRRRRLKAVVSVICLALLALLGWIIYPPVRDFLLESGEPLVGDIGVTSTNSPAEPSKEPSEDSAEAGNAQLPPILTDGIPASLGEIRGAYITGEAAADETALIAQIETFVAGGMNTVMLEAKDAAGIVHFVTSNDIALKNAAVSDTAYLAAETADIIHEQGLFAAARVHAFRDPAASVNKALAVTYGNSETRWLDNSPQLGGKSWLNPCSADARKYVIDLAVELTKAGFDAVVLDSVQFPSGVGLEKAGFGVSGSFSREKVLRDFIAEITAEVEKAGGKLIIAVSTDYVDTTAENQQLARKNGLIYGVSPEKLPTGAAMLIFSENSAQADIISYVKTSAPSVEWLSLVPNYAADGTALSKSEALLAGGLAEGYVLYNPQGSYLMR